MTDEKKEQDVKEKELTLEEISKRDKEEYDSIMEQWINERREARRHGDDLLIKKIDDKYASVVKTHRIKTGSENMDVMNPPLRIPLSVINSFKEEDNQKGK